MNIKQIIELVEKWIADPKSVSRKELKAARSDEAARAAAAAAWHGDTDGAKFLVAEYHRRING